MKKTKILICSLAMILCMAGAASAVPTTWTDTITWNTPVYISTFDYGVLKPYSYFHNITDSGFKGSDGNDTVSGLSLTVYMHDDNKGLKYFPKDGSESATVKILGDCITYEFSMVSTTLSSASLLARIDIWDDGTLNVFIIPTGLNPFTGNDFLLDKSELIVYGDNGDLPPCPVPEPATMLLLGSGLTGLAVFRKKFQS